jgi:alpha-L-fucosidase
LAETLVDIVSKNGNFLLKIPQLPDGTLDEECVYNFGSLAKWMKVNGEGISGTRPWTAAGEGPSQVVIEGFKEDAVPWTVEDFRFIAKGNQVYAFQMKWPEGGKSVIRSLAKGKIANVTGVNVLGSDAPVKFEQTSRGLALDLPNKKPTDFVQCYRVFIE